MDKSIILKNLFDLGFRTDEIEGFGYHFSYEGLNMFYNVEDDDYNFLRLVLPGIYEIGQDHDRAYVMEILNEINLRLKYAKAYLQGDSVWISYETKLYSEDNTEETVRLGILLLKAAFDLFGRIITGKEGLHDDDIDLDDEDEDAEDEGDENL